MELHPYADVHPDWDIIESLDTRQSEAVLDLLATATMVDGDLTAFESKALAEELVELPFVAVDKKTLLDRQLDKTVARLETFDSSPERFYDFIDGTCSAITSEEVQLPVLRLIAIDITIDEPTERQQELFYATGRSWDIDYDTLENILKAVWGSRDRARDERRAASGESRIRGVVETRSIWQTMPD